VANDDENDFTKVLSKLLDFLKKLPLNKITGPKAFDLVFDVIMVIAMWGALRAKLDADRKVLLATICLFLAGASFWFNRPIRRRAR
jgi:fatty acid desaturase